MDTDFIGFRYGGINSRDFDLYRVSISNRYEEQLIPQFNENKTAVPGGDGTYFFDANYTQRQFKISFAFDSLTETQYRQLRLWLGNKDTFKQLIFDERPYKYYMAKPSAPPTLKTICFDEKYIENNVVKTKRIYKGEGEVTFVCYYPFARTVNGKKYINTYAKTSAISDYGVIFDSVILNDPSGTIINNADYLFSEIPDSNIRMRSIGYKVYYGGDKTPIQFKNNVFITSASGSTVLETEQVAYITTDVTAVKLKDNTMVPIASFTYPPYEQAMSNEWKNSVNWLSTKGDFDTFTTTSSSAVAYLYNPGDLSADYKITLNYIPESISMVNDSFGEVQLVHFSNRDWPTITIPTTTVSNGVKVSTTTTTSANRLQIDSKTNMIKVGTTADSSSVAAVDFVPVEMFNTAADVMNFVTIPVDTQDNFIGIPTSTADANTRMVITGVSGSASIDYDYLYY